MMADHGVASFGARMGSSATNGSRESPDEMRSPANADAQRYYEEQQYQLLAGGFKPGMHVTQGPL